MGRQKFNKRDHLENSNRIFESRNKKSIINEQQLGDATGDGYVDQQDVDHVVNNWLQPGDVYDSNDGIINLDDLALTTDNFGQGSQIPSEYCCGGGVTGVGQCIQVPIGTCNQQSMGTGYAGGPYIDLQDCNANGCGGGTTGCDLSCVDLSDNFTDSIVAQGGGPNSLQTYDPNTSYAPGSVVCHLDPTLGVTNVYVASANSGSLIPGGGPYPPPNQWVTAWPWPLPPGASANDYYWEPGLILASCGGNGNWAGGTGDWWCDPTGQYISPTGTPCVQSPTQPQSYFTGPSTTEQDCIAQCGTNQEYVCMGGVAGPVGTNTCTGPHPVGTYQMGQTNVMGIYPTQADCDTGCNGIMCDPPPGGCPQGEIWMPAPICACQTDPNTGTACDISWNTPCAQQHLLTGAQNSWTTFLNMRQTGWDNVGCQHLQNVVNWTTDQLNSGVTGNGTPLNPTQIARKTEKRLWAECQGIQCGCTINMPPLTGTGNRPTEDSHESFTGTVCNCVGDCSNPTSQVGAGFQAGSATHQCNGQMCDQNDLNQIFDYNDGVKTLTFTLNSFSDPGIFGVSETPGINMTSSTCPTPPPSPAPVDKAKPEKKKKEKKKELKEEINRMKSLWRHK